MLATAVLLLSVAKLNAQGTPVITENLSPFTVLEISSLSSLFFGSEF